MDAQAKQQIIERVKQATNILVTVSANPSVDQLAALIGMTLLLNKLQKHATAVFSGKVPSTIEFLQPEKTIETNTDSLQDFIISLDKSKADKLRYKVEDQVVRIFITPYRTSISEKDLMFSHGDFNVQVVLALGIKDRNQIDQAIATHGRILHDATVISINSGPGNVPVIGSINWQDPTASSLSEMMVSISEAFGTGLIDAQMATAFLTGIVAETSRFSNARTSPKVMTMAAQLMAAGANQQLIVNKLTPPPPPLPAAKPMPVAPPPPPPKKDELKISHGPPSPDDLQEIEIAPDEIHIDKQGNLITADELKNEATKKKSTKPPEPPGTTPTEPTQQPPNTTPQPPAPAPPATTTPWSPAAALPEAALTPTPLSLSPASQQAMPEPNLAHALLNPANEGPVINTPFSADMQREWIDPYNTVSMDPLTERPSSANHLFQKPSENGSPPAGVDSARSAVQSALDSAPITPGFGEPDIGLSSQPMGFDAPPPAVQAQPDGIPDLALPNNGNGPITVTPAESIPMPDIAPPAPPPLPPPLPLVNNPGAMLPNTPTFQPPQ